MSSAPAEVYGRERIMKKIRKNKGSVILVVVFAAALLSAITIGILQLNTEEIQLMQNQSGATEAMATAEAGLNDAFSRIYQGNDPNIAGQAFNGGSYSVNAGASSVSDLLITATGVSSQGFTAKIEADVTIGSSSPYIVRIDRLRINE
jgi:predicted PurR-regulated permease PerM